MSEYLDDIQSRVPDMRLVAGRKEAERQRAAAEEAERVRQDSLSTERIARLDEESKELGALAVRYLVEHSVPDVSVLAKRKTGFVHEVGRGWHVATHTFKEYGSKRTEKVGLDSDGAVITISDTTTKDNQGKEWSGLVGVSRINDPERRHAILTSDYFKNGVASLLDGHEPYEYAQPDKPVDDPSQPSLPGM